MLVVFLNTSQLVSPLGTSVGPSRLFSQFSFFVLCMRCWSRDCLGQETANPTEGPAGGYSTAITVESWETDRDSRLLGRDSTSRKLLLTHQSPLRMAFNPLRRFAIWAATATCAGAASSTLPSEITEFVPSCALDCFQSFVSNNYNASVCGTSPSLPCLCQKTGTSGFTVGEGAVQCLVAEINRNSCQGGDASREWI